MVGSPIQKAEVDLLRRFYTALNQNDITGALELFDPQIVRIEFEGSASEGKFRGLAELKEHITKGRGTWAEGSCEPERFVAVANKLVVFVHVRVRLKDKTEWLEGRVGDAFAFRNGKILEFRTFAEGQQALEWAGK